MQGRLALIAAWVAITGLSVFVATQAVGAVRDQVTTAPAPLATIAPAVVDTTTTTTQGSITSTTMSSTTSTTSTTTPSSTTTTGGVTTTTVAATTTSVGTTATTTTTTVPPQIATYQLTGGWVRIQYGSTDVRLVDAAPYAGFSMKLEKTGPPQVEVEFEGEGYEAKFKASIESGELDVVIEEGDDD